MFVSAVFLFNMVRRYFFVVIIWGNVVYMVLLALAILWLFRSEDADHARWCAEYKKPIFLAMLFVSVLMFVHVDIITIVDIVRDIRFIQENLDTLSKKKSRPK